MPPKKEDQKTEVQYKPCFVLPIFAEGFQSRSCLCLSKLVNIKKNIDINKITEFLKAKGQDQYIVNGEISHEGREYVCKNLPLIAEDIISAINKPVDPKKEAKKDTKKDPKKEEVPVEKIVPPIEFSYEKTCDDFIFLLGVPSTPRELETVLSTNVKIDIVLFIKEQVKSGTKKPNYDLLMNDRSYEKMSDLLQNTEADPNESKKEEENEQHNYDANRMVEEIRHYRAKLEKDHQNKNLIILEVPYLDNLLRPEENESVFLDTVFSRVCKCTKEFEKFIEWKSHRKTIQMVEPIKETITKKVQVEEKAEKGKKSKVAEPVFEEVQEVIEKNYEDFPENIRSNLSDYFNIKQTKTSKYSKTEAIKINSIFKEILSNCIDCFETDGANAKNKVDEISEAVKSNKENSAINKVEIKNIAHRLRAIDHYQDVSFDYGFKFSFPTIDSHFSFMDLAKKYKNEKEKLKIEFLINKLEKLAKSSNPRLQWDFGDRQYLERLTKEQIQSAINEELLNDPQITTGYLESEGLRLIVLSQVNPPGRVLYHNNIFEWKVLPDFQNWIDYFYNNSTLLETNSFLNYSFEKTGNLSIKAKNMMPADNTIIRDELFTAGNSQERLLQFFKGNSKFGLTKRSRSNNENFFIYWHEINNRHRIRAFKPQNKVQHNQEQDQSCAERETKSYTGVNVVLECKDNYTISFDPNPTIYWNNPEVEKIRKIGAFGEITSYRCDGSIHIYKPNGDVSIHRNGEWEHFSINNVDENNFIEIKDGESLIKIRNDQTIFVEQEGNTKILFPDGTQMFFNKKHKKIEIKNKKGPFIRIYLPRDEAFNMIGYGSAFAYLGFENLLERSYDGYMFELIDFDISSHHYVEKFEKEGKIMTEDVRIITHRDSSIIKVCQTSSKIVYVSPTPNSIITSEILNQKWLQAFTGEGNFEEGVFWIDVETGKIDNKDSEANQFKSQINDVSDAHIAVSFISQNKNSKSNHFPNGFHVEEENYFLPLPSNRIPPRIFCIGQDGSGTEFLNGEQIGEMREYTVTKELELGKTVIQYTKETKSNMSYLSSTFSKPINLDIFGLPNVLTSPQTKNTLLPPSFSSINHRVIEEISWDQSFSNLKTLEGLLSEEEANKGKLHK